MNQPFNSKPSSNSPQGSQSDFSGKQSFQISAPSISLPKGGGAIRRIGEKFVANPVTGTGSMTVPIATSPGRSGFGPQLSLSYDSGAGNGPFGFGWSLSIPSITRKTDKGLPKYQDADDSDVFILSGAEDLVPVLVKNGTQWKEEKAPARTVDRITYNIRRYRPRIEGLFARIERWTNVGDATDVCWRSISKDNITTWYGKTGNSRIYDPSNPSHIFSWLICESYDDKGNALVYEYKAEDSEGIPLDRVHERNRTSASRGANRYLKHIKYGNEKSRLVQPNLDRAKWLFEVVFDYGEHDDDAPRPKEEPKKWNCRQDPFSTFRAGFDVRTYRLCQRALMFHHFPKEEIGTDCLVRSTDFTYSYEERPDDVRNPIYSFIESVQQIAYQRKGTKYESRSLPPLAFQYQPVKVSDVVCDVNPANLENLPHGLDGTNYQWVDLDGEGLSGILTEQGTGWFYKRNLSPATEHVKNGKKVIDVMLAPVEVVASMPSLAALNGGGQQLMDLAGDGQLDLVCLEGPVQGFYERAADEKWETFRPFLSIPNLNWSDPNLKFIDLTGDGHADVMITEDDALCWYSSLAEDGFGPATHLLNKLDEEKSPRLVFADGTQSIYLADISGDGLIDIARIRNGEVCYWPNLGYGRFGSKVAMDKAPWFDAPDLFDQRRIRLADIDGSGTTDIIYFNHQGVHLYFNQSGNSWSARQTLDAFPPIDNLASVMTADILGNGTACLVWSSPLQGRARQPMRYVDLMGGKKPHVLIHMVNNLGAETHIEYASSTKFYVADRLAGKPWITKIPFPVHCVEKTTVTDKWRKTAFSSSYNYHHGYFDGIEREFRGFGRVEQMDTEDYGAFAKGNAESPYISGDKTLYQPPVKTVTWFHTGAFLDREKVLSHFKEEYFPHWFEALRPNETDVLGNFRENELPEPDLKLQSFSAEEWREALRACKGMLLRQEVYELDVDTLGNSKNRPVKLFSTAYHNCHIESLQPKQENQHAVFLVTESEAITYHYEMDLRPDTVHPDPRIAHTLNLRIDELGNVQQAVAVAYPRIERHRDASLPDGTEDLIADVQQETRLAYTETRYTGDSEDQDNYRLRLPCEVSAYELTGIEPKDRFYFTLNELRAYRLSPERYQMNKSSGDINVVDIPHHQIPDGTTVQKRLVERVRTLFFKNLKTFLPLGELNVLALKYEDYKLSLTDEILRRVFGNAKLTQAVRDDLDDPTVSGYMSRQDLADRFPDEDTDGEYWIRSGTAGLETNAADHFYLPELYTDPFGNETTLDFDQKYDLFLESRTDALGNRVSITDFDYRVLAPRIMKDVNDNLTEVRYDILGLPAVIAVKGKGNEGDNLTNISPTVLNPPIDTIVSYFQDDFDESEARRLLGNATARYVYYMGEEQEGGKTRFATHPPAAGAILRETHVAQLGRGEVSKLQVAFEYSDGMGTVLVKKAEAEPEEGKRKLRWIATGKTVMNNKGKPVKQYEPYFSQTEHRFDNSESEDEIGVTPIMYYDAVGRLIRTELPDGSFSRVEFSPWHVTTYDANDTAYDPIGNQHSDWYQRRKKATHPRFAEFNTPEDRRAADLTKDHANTPSQVFLDSLGRHVVSVAHNKFKYPNSGPMGDEKYVTFTKLDAEGKPLWIRDARRNLVIQYITPVKPTRWKDDRNENIPSGAVPCYDIAGNLLFQHSMDAGDRSTLNDAAGKPMYAWDANERHDSDGTTVKENRRFNTKYDRLHRLTEQWLKINNRTAEMIEKFVYGENVTNATDARWRNLREQLWKHCDQSGRMTVENYDFKGNLLNVERQIASDYKATVIGWQQDSQTNGLDPAKFVKITEYDALNRMTRLYNWHRGVGTRVAVYEPTYNERGLLKSEDLVMRATKTANAYRSSSKQRTTAINDITYNSKGQRQRIGYGNGTITRYNYDPDTFHLVQLRTTRPKYDPAFPSRHSQFKNDRVLQNLFYTYDPSGNITEIYDDAYEPSFFDNQKLDPKNEYTYDALYRLISANGRENRARAGAPTHVESTAANIDFPVQRSDPNALREYTQSFVYDSVDNIRQMRHVAAGGNWTRDYAYALDDSAQVASNRLWQTWEGGDRIQALTYQYDTHGNMLNLANVAPGRFLRWDYRDMLASLDLIGGGWAYYQYDSGKQRTRKCIEHEVTARDGTKRWVKHWERIYLGGYELYRRYNGDGATVIEEIESHHLFEGEQRVLLVDDVVIASDVAHPRPDRLVVKAQTLFRYQYSNHLGSTCLELDYQADIISYEEFHPYGTSAYRATKSGIEAPPKRYRYTGMERDEESGLSYHAARYYAPWLARWPGCDPLHIGAGLNAFAFVANAPIGNVDTDGLAARPINADEKAKVEALVRRAFEYIRDPRNPVYRPPEDNTLVMGMLPNGEPFTGTQSNLTRAKEQVAEEMARERTLRTGNNIAGGIFGAIGYLSGGDEGSDVGAVLDSVADAPAIKGLLERPARSKSFARSPKKGGASDTTSSGTNPLPNSSTNKKQTKTSPLFVEGDYSRKAGKNTIYFPLPKKDPSFSTILEKSKEGYQVYELLDAQGNVLYVGKSGGAGGEKPGSWLDRLIAHASDPQKAEWINATQNIRITSGLNEMEAFAREQTIIQENKLNEGNYDPGAFDVLFPAGGQAANFQSSENRDQFTIQIDIVPNR